MQILFIIKTFAKTLTFNSGIISKFYDLRPGAEYKRYHLRYPRKRPQNLLCQTISLPPGHAFDGCIFVYIDSENFRVTLLLW